VRERKTQLNEALKSKNGENRITGSRGMRAIRARVNKINESSQSQSKGLIPEIIVFTWSQKHVDNLTEACQWGRGTGLFGRGIQKKVRDARRNGPTQATAAKERSEKGEEGTVEGRKGGSRGLFGFYELTQKGGRAARGKGKSVRM